MKHYSHFFLAAVSAALFVATASVAQAKAYDIPEIDGSLILSGAWLPVSPTLVQQYNADMIRLRPQTRTRYVAGFTRGAPSDGSDHTGTACFDASEDRRDEQTRI